MPKSNTVNRMPREDEGKRQRGRKSKQMHSEEKDGERQEAERVADRRS